MPADVDFKLEIFDCNMYLWIVGWDRIEQEIGEPDKLDLNQAWPLQLADWLILGHLTCL